MDSWKSEISISHFLLLCCDSILSSADRDDTSSKRRLAAVLRCSWYTVPVLSHRVIFSADRRQSIPSLP